MLLSIEKTKFSEISRMQNPLFAQKYSHLVAFHKFLPMFFHEVPGQFPAFFLGSN
jgi:hypothetical protein